MANGAETPDATNRIVFVYEPSSQYRTIHVDGAYGGVTPRGQLTITFYSERRPTPRSATHEILDGQLGDLLSSEIQGDVLREVETTAFLDVNAARELHVWLGEQIAKHQSIFGGGESEADT